MNGVTVVSGIPTRDIHGALERADDNGLRSHVTVQFLACLRMNPHFAYVTTPKIPNDV